MIDKQEKGFIQFNDFNVEKEVKMILQDLPELGHDIDVKIDGEMGAIDITEKGNPNGRIRLGGSIECDNKRVVLLDFILESIGTGYIEKHRSYHVILKNENLSIKWHWSIIKRQKDILILCSLENCGDQTLNIRNWNVLHVTDNITDAVFDGIYDETRFFRWKTWDMGVELLSAESNNHVSENILHLYNPIIKKVMFCGFLTLSRMQGRHSIITDRNRGIIEYKAECLFGTYALQPRQKFNSELLNICFYDDPYEILENWSDKMKAIYQPNIKSLPPVGWCGGSWESGFPATGDSWESYSIRNLQEIKKRLKGFEINYMWTSQSNLKDYIPGNWLHVNKGEIPSGLKGYFDKLKELGFIPGLWVSPFWFYGEACSMLEEHKDNLLKDATGEPICIEETWGWRYDDDIPWYHMHKYFLDGSHPKTKEYIKELFSYYYEIGVRYYMLDFLGIVEESQLHDQSKTPYQAGYSILKSIRESSGEETHIQTAVSSSPGFTGIINAARVGRDFGEGRPLEGGSLSDWRNATHVLHDMHYANTKYFLQNAAANYFTHQKLYMNDINLLTIDKPYPTDYARIVTTMFGLMGGSPIMLGDDFIKLDEERLRMIKLCLPRTQHSARPVDLFERVQPREYSRILKLEINTDWDSYLLVGVFNMDDKPYDMLLDFIQLGLCTNEKYVLFDFWNEEYCGIFKESFPCNIPPNSCRLFRISKARPYPWLMSTDMHIQQGFVEVKDIKWNDESNSLSGTVTRPVGETGNIYILMPRKYKLKNPRGKRLLKELLDFNVIIRLPILFENETEYFELFFDYWELDMIAPKGLIPYSTEQEWLDYMHTHYKKEKTRVFE